MVETSWTYSRKETISQMSRAPTSTTEISCTDIMQCVEERSWYHIQVSCETKVLMEKELNRRPRGKGTWNRHWCLIHKGWYIWVKLDHFQARMPPIVSTFRNFFHDIICPGVRSSHSNYVRRGSTCWQNGKIRKLTTILITWFHVVFCFRERISGTASCP